MLSRRAFLVSALATSSAFPAVARTQTTPPAGSGSGTQPTVLRLQRRSIEVNGKPASVFGNPAARRYLRHQDGRRRAVSRALLENNIDEPSLIHWHGLTPPWQQDGVPGVSGPPIPAWRQRRL